MVTVTVFICYLLLKSSVNMGSIQDPAPSFFENAQPIPPDAIFQVTKDFLADPNPKKVNLGPGTYRDENGNPWVLPSVRMAKKLVSECGHEYLPIAGLKTFRDKALKLVFEGTNAFNEDRVIIKPPLFFKMLKLLPDRVMSIALRNWITLSCRLCPEEDQSNAQECLHYRSHLVKPRSSLQHARIQREKATLLQKGSF